MFKHLSEKNKLSKEHTQKYRKEFAFNRNVAGFNKKIKEMIYTLVSDIAEGPYIYDIDGNRYIDLTMGFGAILLGHNDQEVTAAIQNQMSKSWSVGPVSPLAGILSKEISDITGVERVGYFNSGTEAIMVALRLAKAVTKKDKIVFFRGSYHGTFDSLLSLKNDPRTYQAQEIIPGVTQSILNESYILEYGSDEALEFIKKNNKNIAAILCEPVQSRNPGLQPKAFLKALRNITKENEIALIFDEVITGFRIGLGGAQEYFGIKADIVTYGKVVGGGLPIGIVAGKARFLDALDGGYWEFGDESIPVVKTTFVAGTFCQHPMAMAASLKMLEILKRSNGKILDDLNERTTAFCNRLNSFFQEQDYKISVTNFASLFRFTTPGKCKMLYYQLLMNGVYIWEGRNCFLSPSHNDQVLATLEEIIKMSCKQLEEQGLVRACPQE